jgi:hypothetical protein
MGRRPTYTLAARTQVVAVAQQMPERRADQSATWSLATLQRHLRRAGLPRVGATTIRRVLLEAGSNYQRTRIWCPTGTARRLREQGLARAGATAYPYGVVRPANSQSPGPFPGQGLTRG